MGAAGDLGEQMEGSCLYKQNNCRAHVVGKGSISVDFIWFFLGEQKGVVLAK
jgi:hypothetical protein